MSISEIEIFWRLVGIQIILFEPLSPTAEMCAVSRSRHAYCVAPQTCLMCHKTDMSAVAQCEFTHADKVYTPLKELVMCPLFMATHGTLHYPPSLSLAAS